MKDPMFGALESLFGRFSPTEPVEFHQFFASFFMPFSSVSESAYRTDNFPAIPWERKSPQEASRHARQSLCDYEKMPRVRVSTFISLFDRYFLARINGSEKISTGSRRISKPCWWKCLQPPRIHRARMGLRRFLPLGMSACPAAPHLGDLRIVELTRVWLNSCL